VRQFAELVGAEVLRAAASAGGADAGHRTRIGCIGPVTAATAHELGLPVDIQPETYTIAAFTDAIVAHFATAG
jgi:uroporphyrinogen III methyltransferase/synthase